jgi:leucyl aminopeptidase (aminopeptidase T)
VTIFLYPHNVPLAEDLARECFRVGADVNLSLYTDRFYEDYMKLLSEDSLRQPSVYCRGLTELSTAEFWLGSAYDPAVFRRIPPEKMAANEEGETAAHLAPARERKVRSLFVALGQVTRPRARAYGFPFAAWERNVREASAVRPEKLTADGRRLAALLGSADRVRIRADGGTDLELSARGRRAHVYDGVVDEEDIAAGTLNAAIPAGSVTIAPVETDADGTVVFDVPQPWAGRMIRRLRWEFSGGHLTAFDGDRTALALRKTWELASGDKDRIGMLAIGLNPKARIGFLSNDIVRGAVSLAIGGNEDEGGANKPGFFHAQALADASVEVDGKPIVRSGKLLLA